MADVSKIRYTDADRYRKPYITAKDSQEPGYLARRFDEIRAEQERNATEQKAKVAPMKRAAK